MEVIKHGSSVPLLNSDILSNVCIFLTEYPDLLTVSLTCSTLRPIAVRSLLRNRPVVLKQSSTICKFHGFVFADATARLPYITGLEVDVPHDAGATTGFEQAAFDSLLAVLRGASSLKSLTLWSSDSDWPLVYIGDPEVSAVVSALPSLQELAISGGDDEIDFPRIIRSPLRKLTILGIFPEVSGELRWSPGSLSASLSHVAASLEILAIHSAEGLFDESPVSLPTPVPFYAVRSLSLDNIEGVPNLSILLDLFPNLNGTLDLRSLDSSVDLMSIDDAHNNITAIRRLNGEAPQEQRSWKRLERVVCDLDMLFVLNLKCPISLTVVHSCTPLTRRCLVESLRENPPSRLNLQMTLSPWFQSFSGTVIPLDAAPTLTHLTLCICYNGVLRTIFASPMRWDIFVQESILPTIRPLLSLTHLRIIFHCEDRATDHKFCNSLLGEEGMSRNSFPTQSCPPSFECADAASAIMAAQPSLRYVFLTTSSCVVDEMAAGTPPSIRDQWKKSHAWRIPVADSGKDTKREPVELHDDVAEAIISKEGLSPSEFEVVSVIERFS